MSTADLQPIQRSDPPSRYRRFLNALLTPQRPPLHLGAEGGDGLLLVPGWANPDGQARVALDNLGRVSFAGFLTVSEAPTEDPFLTLPTGYRPTTFVELAAVYLAPTPRPLALVINAGGACHLFYTAGAPAGTLLLDGISFDPRI